MAKVDRQVVFFGNERLSSATDYDRAPILQALLKEGYKIEALIVKNNETRSRAAHEPAIIRLATEHGLNVVRVRTAVELQAIVTQLTARIAILASFGMLLSDRVIQQFPLGIVNAHPSLLPAWRGPTPIESALLNGERETGVSLMKINSEFDAGDVYAREKLAVGKNENKLNLTIRLGELAADMLARNLPLILEQRLQPRPQDHSQATYGYPIESAPALQFEQHSADYLERHSRAFAGCPNNKFMLCEQTVEIVSAAAVSRPQQTIPLAYDRVDKLLYARCRQGCLAISRLHPQNRNEMTATDFANGFCRGAIKRSGSA